MTIFLVNGQEYKLTLPDKSGVDYSGDFIGNTSHGMQKDEEGRYIATPEDLEWWQRVMSEHEEMNELINEYSDKYGFETVFKALNQDGALDVDMDMMLKSVRCSLQTLDD